MSFEDYTKRMKLQKAQAATVNLVDSLTRAIDNQQIRSLEDLKDHEWYLELRKELEKIERLK